MLRAAAVEGGPDLIAAFNAARDRQYGEIIAGCGEIVARIEAMTAAISATTIWEKWTRN